MRKGVEKSLGNRMMGAIFLVNPGGVMDQRGTFENDDDDDDVDRNL